MLTSIIWAHDCLAAGWEDGPFHYAHKEAGRINEVPYHPHTYSVRPLDFNGTLPDASPSHKPTTDGSPALNSSVKNDFISTAFLTSTTLTVGALTNGTTGSLAEGPLASQVFGNRPQNTGDSATKSPLAVNSLANGSLAEVPIAADSAPLNLTDSQPVSNNFSLPPDTNDTNA